MQWPGELCGKLAAILTHPVALVGYGSAVGGMLRYVVGRWIDTRPGAGAFPWGTFVVNVSGSFILALVALVALERAAPGRRELYLLLGTGFCGGFTTFSTLEWETFKLVRDGSHWLALAYVFGSFLCGFLGVLAAVLAVNLTLGRQ